MEQRLTQKKDTNVVVVDQHHQILDASNVTTNALAVVVDTIMDEDENEKRKNDYEKTLVNEDTTKIDGKLLVSKEKQPERELEEGELVSESDSDEDVISVIDLTVDDYVHNIKGNGKGKGKGNGDGDGDSGQGSSNGNGIGRSGSSIVANGNANVKEMEKLKLDVVDSMKVGPFQQDVIDALSPCIDDIIDLSVSQEDMNLIGGEQDFVYGDFEEGEIQALDDHENYVHISDNASSVNFTWRNIDAERLERAGEQQKQEAIELAKRMQFPQLMQNNSAELQKDQKKEEDHPPSMKIATSKDVVAPDGGEDPEDGEIVSPDPWSAAVCAKESHRDGGEDIKVCVLEAGDIANNANQLYFMVNDVKQNDDGETTNVEGEIVQLTSVDTIQANDGNDGAVGGGSNLPTNETKNVKKNNEGVTKIYDANGLATEIVPSDGSDYLVVVDTNIAIIDEANEHLGSDEQSRAIKMLWLVPLNFPLQFPLQLPLTLPLELPLPVLPPRFTQSSAQQHPAKTSDKKLERVHVNNFHFNEPPLLNLYEHKAPPTQIDPLTEALCQDETLVKLPDPIEQAIIQAAKDVNTRMVNEAALMESLGRDLKEKLSTRQDAAAAAAVDSPKEYATLQTVDMTKFDDKAQQGQDCKNPEQPANSSACEGGEDAEADTDSDSDSDIGFKLPQSIMENIDQIINRYELKSFKIPPSSPVNPNLEDCPSTSKAARGGGGGGGGGGGYAFSFLPIDATPEAPSSSSSCNPAAPLDVGGIVPLTTAATNEELPIFGPEWIFPSPIPVLKAPGQVDHSPSPRLYRKEQRLRTFGPKERPYTNRPKPYDKPQTETMVQKLVRRAALPPQPYCAYTSRARIPPYAITLYDEHGRLRRNGADICDCGEASCRGCWYNCFECGSPRCGLSCRCNRQVYPDTWKWTKQQSKRSHH